MQLPRLAPAIILLTVLFFSCDNSVTDNGDEEAPVIHLYYPTQNAGWHIGDTVSIHALITDNDKLNQLYASVTGPDAELYYDIQPVVSGLSSYTFQTSWVVGGVINPPVNGVVTIAVTDMNGNYQSASQTVYLYN